MINFLSSWVKNLSFALIIVSILEMILPNNKTKKYVKMVMGLYILFSIIAPFIENNELINLNNINIEDYSKQCETASTYVDQTSMDNRLNEIYRKELEKDILSKIEEKGYKVQECAVKAHVSQKDSGIEEIILRIEKKVEESSEKNNVESKIVAEIQKIKKIEKIEIGEEKENKEYEDNEKIEKSKITKTDIKIIKDLLISEYGVNEQCLKIS